MRDTVYRFGHFVVEADARRLFHHGLRQPLQEQPFQLLLALLEQPGEIVTRETLRLRLWGTHTFVDFDQSLNSVVRRLRQALHDNPRAPEFVMTVPRIGFRFLAGVAAERQGQEDSYPPPASATYGLTLAT